MASNPATAFDPASLDPFQNTLPAMEDAPEDMQAIPAQRLPDNGVGGLPGMGGGYMSDLQRQAFESAIKTLQEPEPKATIGQKFRTYGALLGAPTSQQRDWKTRQDQAMRVLQAMGQMTAMGRLGIAEGNLGARLYGLGQGDKRIEQAGQRLTLAQADQMYKQKGLTTFHTTEYNPDTGRNETSIYGLAHDPGTGQEYVVSKQFVAEAPLTFSQPIEVSGGGTVQTTMQPTSTAPSPLSSAIPVQTPDTAHSANHPAQLAEISGTPSTADITPKTSPHSPKPSVIPSPVVKQPPPGAAIQFQDKLRFMQSLEGIAQLHDLAQESVKGGMLGNLGTLGQIGADQLADTKYGRALVGDPEVAFKQGIKWAIYQYVKQQTGAQFSIQEMDRYDRMFPTLADSPVRTRLLIKSAVNAVMNGVRNAQAQWGGLRAPGYTPDMQAADDAPPPELDAFTSQQKSNVRKVIPRSAINALPEADRAATEAGIKAKGGTIDENR